MKEAWQPSVTVEVDVVTARLEKNLPLPESTARIVWLLNKFLGPAEGVE